MRNILKSIIVVTVVVLCVPYMYVVAQLPLTVPTSLPATQSSLREGPQLIADLYKILLRKSSPTMAEEQRLFNLKSALRRNLIETQRGNDADPIILNFLRKNLAQLVPLHMRSPNVIRISTTFSFSDMEAIDSGARPTVDAGFVMVVFPEDDSSIVKKYRTVVFAISGGKIDFDSLRIKGFNGQTAYQELFKEP